MIELRPIDESFCYYAAVWFQDPEFRGLDTGNWPWSVDQVWTKLRECAANGAMVWAVHDSTGPIGFVMLEEWNRYHETAVVHTRMGVRNTGRGVHATALAMDWAFETMRVHKIKAKRATPLRNEDRLWTKEGVEKESIRCPDGRRADLHIYGITRPEFYRHPIWQRMLGYKVSRHTASRDSGDRIEVVAHG